MAHSKKNRIAAATLTAAAIVGGGIIAAAPASARTVLVDCPARPYWANGVELWLNTGGNYCFADDNTGYQELYTNVNGVQDATSGLNYAGIDILGWGTWQIHPGQSLHIAAGGKTVTGVYIHGPI